MVASAHVVTFLPAVFIVWHLPLVRWRGGEVVVRGQSEESEDQEKGSGGKRTERRNGREERGEGRGTRVSEETVM